MITSTELNIRTSSLLSFYKTEKKRVEDLLLALNESIKSIESPYKTYSKNYPIPKKVTYIFQTENKPLTTKEVVAIILSLEPELKNNRRKLLHNVAAFLSEAANGKRNKLFTRIQNSENENEYVYTYINKKGLNEQPLK